MTATATKHDQVLELAPEIHLPLDVITDKVAFLAQSGGGKTYGAMHMAECMLDVGAQIVVLDPSGVWWGLCSSADGKAAGYPIIVMGGKRGHIPLDPKSGRLVAQFIVKNRVSVVLDVSNWTLSQQAHFTSELADELFQAQVNDPQPIHLYIEEAHTFIPQQIPSEAKEAAVMLGRMRRLVKIGRNHGVGVTMVSQEPQSIDKRCLNLSAVLFAGRLMGDLERKAIERWFGDNARDKSDFKIVAELPNMDTGEFFLCSPHLLKLFKRVRMGKKRTFDSSATPKFGQRVVEPKKIADVDIQRLRDQMGEMVAQVEADDPKVLKKRIAELERELKAKPVQHVEKVKVEKVEVPILRESDVKRLEKIGNECLLAASEAEAASKQFLGMVREAVAKATPASSAPTRVSPAHPASSSWTPPSSPAAAIARLATALQPLETGELAGLKKGAREMLRLLVASQHQLGRGLTKRALATLAGMRPSGTFGDYLSLLRSKGFIGYDAEGHPCATAEGIAAVPEPGQLPTVDHVIARWAATGHLKLGARKMLDHLVAKHPVPSSREEIAGAVGMEQSGTFGDYLSLLKSSGLAEKYGKDWAADDAIFLGGR